MLRFPLPLLALTFAAGIVAASHTSVGRCDSGGAPALGIVELSSGDAAATYYVDDRNSVVGNGIWIYQESNGVWTSQGPGLHQGDASNHNLQRGGGACYPCLIPDDGDTCTDVGNYDPDLLMI